VIERHKACASEFDYKAWKEFGNWRRAYFVAHSTDIRKDCWNLCDYPSECRWEKQVEINPEEPSPPPLLAKEDVPLAGKPSALPVAVMFDSILQTCAKVAVPSSLEPPKDNFWSPFLASATRRNKAAKSPLALTTVAEEIEGDVEMTVVSPKAIEPSLKIPEVDIGFGIDAVDYVVGEMKRSIC
jgi:hypothetical protein